MASFNAAQRALAASYPGLAIWDDADPRCPDAIRALGTLPYLPADLGVPILQPVAGNGVIVIGDSIPRGGSIGDGTIFNGNIGFRNSREYLAWCSIYSNGTVRYLRNAATNGDVMSGVLGRLTTDALVYNPSMVIFDIGRNDIVVGTTLSTYLSGVFQCISRCRAVGITPVFTSLLPDDNMTSAQTSQLRIWNHEIAQACRQTNTIYVDNFSLVADPATGLWQANTLRYDGSHPGTKAARLIALNVNKAIVPALPAFIPHLEGDQSTYTTGVSLLGNNCFLTDAGGGVPSGWTPSLPSHTTCSLVSATSPQVGNWVKLACDSSVVTTNASLNQVISSALWAPGDYLRFAAWLQFACPDNGGNPSIIMFRNGTTLDYLTPVPDAFDPSWDSNGGPVLWNVTYPVPAGTTSLVMYIQLTTAAGMAATFQMAQLTAINLTKQGLLPLS